MNTAVKNAGSAMDRLKQRGANSPATSAMEVDIPLAKIRFDPTQPRQAFHVFDGRIADKDEAYIAELAQTIDQQGLIQAITVKENGDGTYTVVVGECRTRAHLLLDKQTIRAVIRNDLVEPVKRLLYQLVENVSREDLTEYELAQSIAKLKKGSDTEPPMTQTQIAKSLGKSEGWVTRFVKFADEDLQHRWVRSGIAPVAENMYRLSLLPTSLQVDIVRRVALPVGDADRLETPLSRKVIDDYSQEAKIIKVAAKSPGTPLFPAPSGGVVPVKTSTLGVQPSDGVPGTGDGVVGGGGNSGVAPGDEVGQTLAALAAQGQAAQTGAATNAAMPAGVEGIQLGVEPGAYQLSPQARADLLGTIPNWSGVQTTPGEAVQAPVQCRVSAVNWIALIEKLKTNEKVRDSLDGVPCSFSIPGALAQVIANELKGMIVEPHEVPMVIQNEIAKLF